MSALAWGIGAGVGSIIGSGASSAYSASMARAQRKWQTEMSNTAYQRAVKDMKKAGINPMLAYMKGGASQPSPGTVGDAPDFSGAINSAMQLRRSKEELRLLSAQADKTENEGAVTGAEVPIANAKADITRGLIERLKKAAGITSDPSSGFHLKTTPSTPWGELDRAPRVRKRIRKKKHGPSRH